MIHQHRSSRLVIELLSIVALIWSCAVTVSSLRISSATHWHIGANRRTAGINRSTVVNLSPNLPRLRLRQMAAADGDIVTGVIIIDHGSKRAAANDKLIQLCEEFKAKYNYAIVEPAHMELAEPSILEAFSRCVAQGANNIICHPFFLSPGRHVAEDVPRLVAEAAAAVQQQQQQQAGVEATGTGLVSQCRYTITKPLGSDNDGIMKLMDASIANAESNTKS